MALVEALELEEDEDEDAEADTDIDQLDEDADGDVDYESEDEDTRSFQRTRRHRDQYQGEGDSEEDEDPDADADADGDEDEEEMDERSASQVGSHRFLNGRGHAQGFGYSNSQSSSSQHRYQYGVHHYPYQQSGYRGTHYDSNGQYTSHPHDQLLQQPGSSFHLQPISYSASSTYGLGPADFSLTRTQSHTTSSLRTEPKPDGVNGTDGTEMEMEGQRKVALDVSNLRGGSADGEGEGGKEGGDTLKEHHQNGNGKEGVETPSSVPATTSPAAPTDPPSKQYSNGIKTSGENGIQGLNYDYASWVYRYNDTSSSSLQPRSHYPGRAEDERVELST